MPLFFVGLGDAHEVRDVALQGLKAEDTVLVNDHLIFEVAVNVSAKDLEDLELPERLDQRCRDAGADPAWMILELTETSAMREAKKQYVDIVFSDADHGFFCDARKSYQPNAARLSWDITQSFLNARL